MSEIEQGDDLERAALAMLEPRLNLVRNLTQANKKISALRADLSEAERDYKQAWKAALAGGWSPGELKKLGMSNPTPRKTQTK